MRREGCIRKGKSDARFEGVGDVRPVNLGGGRSFSNKVAARAKALKRDEQG